MSAPTTAASSPTDPPLRSAATVRMLAPDLARGFTLLGIAIANLTTTWLAGPAGASVQELGGVVDGSTADKVAVVAGSMLAHVRGLPMFSTMLGFGVGLIAMSLARRRYPLGAARRTIAMRYLWLAIFGAVHMVFLYFGDIMVFYGIAGAVLALMINFRDKTLLIIAGVLSAMWMIGNLIIAIVLMIADSQFDLFGPETTASGGMPLASNFLDSYLSQLVGGALFLVLQPLNLGTEIPMLFPLMLLGFVWARRGVLTHPEEHRRTLWIAAAAGIVVMVAVGLPMGLNAIGVFGNEDSLATWMVLNTGFGVATGPGIVAIIVLACAPMQRRITEKTAQGTSYERALPVWIAPVAALGQRSMSGYVAQSLLATIFVASYGLGWGQSSGAAVATGLAAAIWAVTVLGAYALQLMGRRGPLETLHRRMAYGKQGLAADYWARHPQPHPGVPPQGAMAAGSPAAPGQQPPAPPVLPPRFSHQSQTQPEQPRTAAAHPEQRDSGPAAP
ncbi:MULTISPECIES: DUF418 domain-containing protein [Corynebacterium]|uniref:DUF418 domain-containing protein n=1 Tax=Corynebacterium TaxID=1716 RepID=UPI00178C6980|nr:MULTISPECIES: DUF418 domain-containing protein [Corynebacterium]